ncbi:MAG: glycosyltransferase [Candidatus Levybacteria bacterium]|nr:glycosyltransferase [Candidatus Levybacteria bacterium]
MKSIKTHYIPNSALLFIIVSPFTILFYATYVFNPANAGNLFLYAFQLTGDIIAISIVSALWLTILLDLFQPQHFKKDYSYRDAWVKSKKPTVDVLMPVANEAIKVVEKTLINVIAMDYPHKTYILDDGHSDEVKALAEKHGAHYISRPKENKRHAKSGNLNHGLQFCKGTYVAVFDADHVPKKNFITELLPFFENEKVGLVQTPQHFINTDNYIASGTAQAQDIFYKYVQPAKNSYNSAFCVGTNMIYRRSALTDIGGVALRDHSEDIWTSILLHEKGWETIFYNKILAEGVAPETIGSFFRQQNRWSRGGFSLFFTHNPLFIKELTLDQRLQYFFSNIHYFSAFTVLIFLLFPIIYLLFGLHPMDITNSNNWFIHYIPYFITVYFLPWFLLGTIKMSTISTSAASFAPYLKAFVSVALKNNYKWVATESKSKSVYLLMSDIWPHVLIIVLSILAVVVGWYNPNDVVTTAVSTFWVLLNSYVLFLFIFHGVSKKS